ncbi:MAG: hypothetical protein JW817_04685, partial [Clostridiales bacterium]|nr:hypothetical protein [Clostridiales bacterium]
MKKFSEQFKKELNEVRADQDLLDRTLEKVRAESERTASESAKSFSSTRKEPRRNRVVFLKTVVALAAVALVTGGSIFFVSQLAKSDEAGSYADGPVNEQMMKSASEEALSVSDSMAFAPEEYEDPDSDPSPPRDPDLVRLDDYETLLAQMRRYNR